MLSFITPLILIGNCISFVGALFRVASCLANEHKRIFWLQGIDCLIMAVASIFFNSYAGITTLLLSALRSVLVAKGHYSKKMMVLFTVLTLFLGIPLNNRGLIGLLPVLATVEYTICSYYLTGVKATKISIFINLLHWVVYAALVQDYATVVFDCAVLIVDGFAIFRIIHAEQVRKKEIPLRL